MKAKAPKARAMAIALAIVAVAFCAGLLAEQNLTFSPSTETVPALPKRIPPGCEAAFGSAADPARAHIYTRCTV
jgi:hypothetical protein